MNLERVGGPSDGGIDLQGWWWLPRLGDTRRRRIRVLAQCKAEKKKMSPNYVREMEGVLHRHLAAHNTRTVTPPDAQSVEDAQRSLIAVLISESMFTKKTLLRALSSPIPMLLLHLPPLLDWRTESPIVRAESDEDMTSPSSIGAVFWNSALGGEKGLLGGEIEVRWERGGDGTGRPGLWRRDGMRISSWTPDGPVLEATKGSSCC